MNEEAPEPGLARMGAIYREVWVAVLGQSDPATAHQMLAAALTEMRQLTEAAEAAAFGPTTSLFAARDEWAALHVRLEHIRSRIVALELALQAARHASGDRSSFAADRENPLKPNGDQNSKRKRAPSPRPD